MLGRQGGHVQVVRHQVQGASTTMKDIEIVNDDAGAPTVRLHSKAKAWTVEKGISKVLVSLSHSETVVIAFAQVSS